MYINQIYNRKTFFHVNKIQTSKMTSSHSKQLTSLNVDIYPLTPSSHFSPPKYRHTPHRKKKLMIQSMWSMRKPNTNSALDGTIQGVKRGWADRATTSRSTREINAKTYRNQRQNVPRIYSQRLTISPSRMGISITVNPAVGSLCLACERAGGGHRAAPTQQQIVPGI